ncbi:unnamed protein product [Ilex paraguariensis]|uniref:3'-5' exonuclease domain-containing protein n=1 Tax=Ilex paraguariensis TaxID=185542 RepID=A0ABC8SHK0_9AQUA
MAGTVYLRTNRFEVKLEGITFKTKEFESLCAMDFLFPKGKVWHQPPVVGLDVMRHPRDPNIILVFLCFGTGCVILRFCSGDTLPDPILKFLTDQRIQFVGFGIPEKKDLFPFEELGLKKCKTDIGYLAAKHLSDPKLERCELAELAQAVLRIKRMVGLTKGSSFERHEQIKGEICQLFISTVIAMTLLGHGTRKTTEESPKKSSFLKNLNSLPWLNEGWFKISKGKKGDTPGDNSNREAVSPTEKLIKGILKSPSTEFQGCNISSPKLGSPPSTAKEQHTTTGPNLKRANSKGHNVVVPDSVLYSLSPLFNNIISNGPDCLIFKSMAAEYSVVELYVGYDVLFFK